jgi:hypothetical protein
MKLFTLRQLRATTVMLNPSCISQLALSKQSCRGVPGTAAQCHQMKSRGQHIACIVYVLEQMLRLHHNAFYKQRINLFVCIFKCCRCHLRSSGLWRMQASASACT